MEFTPAQLNQLRAFFASGLGADNNSSTGPPASVPVTTEAPITNRYETRATIGLGLPTSHGQHGHPAPLPPSASTTQPFLGFQAIQPPDLRQAAQNRRNAAAINIPRTPALQQRRARTNPSGQRTRGLAQHPPSLQAPVRDPVAACQYNTTNAQGQNVAMIRVTMKCYPRQQSHNETQLFVFKNLKQTTNDWLMEHYLLYTFEIPLETPVVELLKMLVTKLEESLFDWKFARPPAGVNANEALPIQLLQLLNRGNPRPNTGLVHLRRYAHSPGELVSALVRNKFAFAHHDICNENEHFIFYSIMNAPSTALACLPGDLHAQIHTSIGDRFYSRFPTDNPANVNNADVLSDDDSDDEIDEENRPYGIRPRCLLRQDTSNGGQPFPYLPPAIWTSPFTASTGRYRGVLLSSVPLVEQAQELATDGVNLPRLSVSGRSASDVGAAFREMLVEAIGTNDFTKILSPDRSFNIIDEHGDTVSLGDGVEREVLHLLMEGIRQSRGEYFLPLSGELCTLATAHSFYSSCFASSARLLDMSVFGALAALCLIRGISPTPLSPIVIQYIIHNCDIHAIEEPMLNEWLPSLQNLLVAWRRAGPEGNITEFIGHFATYHNTQVGCLRQRNSESHAAIGVEMIKNAAIGPEPPSHPEWTAFCKGFNLTCSNGFTFPEFAKSIEGGTASMLSSTYCTTMNSWERLSRHVTFSEPPAMFRNHLRASLGDPSSTFRGIIESFMLGTGVPNTELFHVASAHFDSSVNVNDVGEPGYRAKHLCWATTGSYQKESDSGKISICFVEDSDTTYPSGEGRAAMIANGTICFRTCLRKAIIPASYVLRLSESQYPDDTFRGFQDAFNHWFLCQILSAIGGHTII